MPNERADAAGQAPTAGATPAVRPRRVLVVDDAEDLRDLLQLYLEAQGHTVETVADGESAVARLLAVRPDIALVDVGLPDIDGYEVARRVRAHPDGRELFLVALTGHRGPAARAQATAAGFDLHLVKPVELKALTALLGSERPAPRVTVGG